MSKKKKIKKFDALLDKYIKNQEVVQLMRTVVDGEYSIDGIIVRSSNDFLQIVETHDFSFNGQVIIGKSQFESIRCNKFDKTQRKILKKEGLLNKKQASGVDINLANWGSIFEDLMTKDIHVIVECEKFKEAKLRHWTHYQSR